MANNADIRYLTPVAVDNTKKKYCRFKRSGIKYIDYKDHEFLKKYNSDILFSHIDITGSSLYKAFGIDIGIDPNLLCMYFNNVFNGHIHLGQKLECIIDGLTDDGEMYVTRSYRDVPDTDGCVFVNKEKEHKVGDFIECIVKEAYEYDLTAKELK